MKRFALLISLVLVTTLVGVVNIGRAQEPQVKFTHEGTDLMVTEVTPLKLAGVNNQQTCNLPFGCDILAEPGVLGADDYQEAQNNPSAIWTGSKDHYVLENETGSVLLPGWGYVTAFAASLRLEGAGYTAIFPPCGESCAWGVVVRGDVDGEQISLELSEYGAAGAATVTRYAVPEQAGGFFSENYFLAQAINALNRDNCRADGCDRFCGATVDFNSGSISGGCTIDGENWEDIFTNLAD